MIFASQCDAPPPGSAAKGIEHPLDLAAPHCTNQPGVPRETPFPVRRNTPETDDRLSRCQKQTGTATMQFLIELIYDYACCQHLVAIESREDER